MTFPKASATQKRINWWERPLKDSDNNKTQSFGVTSSIRQFHKTCCSWSGDKFFNFLLKFFLCPWERAVRLHGVVSQLPKKLPVIGDRSKFWRPATNTWTLIHCQSSSWNSDIFVSSSVASQILKFQFEHMRKQMRCLFKFWKWRQTRTQQNVSFSFWSKSKVQKRHIGSTHTHQF